MKVVVCVKQVIDTEAAITLQGDSIDWGSSPMVLNPFDEYGVEGALQLKDAHGAEVIALSVGADSETEALRRALAMGADSAVLVHQENVSPLSSLSVAKMIAAAIQQIGDVSMVIFGRQSTDSGSGVMAAQVARCLKQPLLGYIGKIEVKNNQILCERILEEEKLEVQAALPCVLSIVQSIGEPRYPSFIGIKRAQKAEIQQIEASELRILETMTSHRQYHLPKAKTTSCQFIKGNDAADTAKLVIGKLVEAKIL